VEGRDLIVKNDEVSCAPPRTETRRRDLPPRR
jgi:hypothetical protein